MAKTTGKSVTGKEEEPPGDDSLIALHALLQIRGSGSETSKPTPVVQGRENSSDEKQNCLDVHKGRAKHMEGKNTTTSNMMDIAQSVIPTQSVMPTHFPYNAAQIAAFQAAAASATMQNAAALGMLSPPNPGSYLPNQLKSSSFPPTTDGSCMKPSVADLTTVSSSSQTMVVSSPVSSIGAKENFHSTANRRHPGKPENTIRQDEVEAALRSKPQRGRKRENLNVMERLELTRTRNREHAKTTRVRKKARYQELLGKEESLLQKCNQEEKVEKRRQDVIFFISAREKMLHYANSLSQVRSIKPPAPAPPKSLSMESCGDGDENRIVRFRSVSEISAVSPQHENVNCKPARDCEGEPKRTLTKGVVEEFLSDTVGDIEVFQFKSSFIAVHGNNKQAQADAVGCMKSFDDILRSCITSNSSIADISKIHYRVPGSSESIAFNKVGSGGLTRVNLVSGKEEILVSWVVTFQFDSSTDKLCSVDWAIVEDFIGLNTYCSSSAGCTTSLTSQKNFPSVVSLDPSSHRDDVMSPGPQSKASGDEVIHEAEAGMDI